jgi:DNA ligase 1
MSETKFPTLYHRGKNGELWEWSVSVVGFDVITHVGQLGGAIQRFSKEAEPKNIGRSNETTPEEQALLEARSMWERKLKGKYSQTPEAAELPKYKPMLAHKWQDHAHKIRLPWLFQPKFDGFRCLCFKEDGKITLYSRSGEVFDLPHLSEELRGLPDPSVLDGELYRHGVSFQKIQSWIQRSQPQSKTVNYHVYDVPEMGDNADLSMEDRNKLLETMASYSWKNIVIVPAISLASEEEVMEYHAQCVSQGYEGAMGRNPMAKYRYDYRSRDLLKIKAPDDSDYVIVGGRPGIGKMSDMCVFECEVRPDLRFDVMPKGDAALREQYLVDLPKLIGKKLKVQHFGFYASGKPKFPVGIAVRDEFDS